MKKQVSVLLLIIMLFLCGCNATPDASGVVATTKPIYDFTVLLCDGTNIPVTQLITENVSCLHDYTLQVKQMRAIESAEVIIISGAGLEDFLQDALSNTNNTIDASSGIALHCATHSYAHSHNEHHHDSDPHIWLSIKNARQMAANIYSGLCLQYPEKKSILDQNLSILNKQFDNLEAYAARELAVLSTRDLITFHDGFSYFAEEWDLNIIHAVEEEAGSEASAAELKKLIQLIEQYELPAVFTEENGSTSAANIVSRDADIDVYALNMAMSEKCYFDAMKQNIDAIKEALG